MTRVFQEVHAVLPQATLDEAARQEFINQLGKHVLNEFTPGTRVAYERDVLPTFKREHGREPTDRHEIRKVMIEHPFYRMTSSFQRTVQEMMWDSVDESIQRQLPDLIDTSRKIAAGNTIGSISLKDGFEIPRYVSENDHHAMPGGYSGDLCDGDITAGALYDRGALSTRKVCLVRVWMASARRPASWPVDCGRDWRRRKSSRSVARPVGQPSG